MRFSAGIGDGECGLFCGFSIEAVFGDAKHLTPRDSCPAARKLDIQAVGWRGRILRDIERVLSLIHI